MLVACWSREEVKDKLDGTVSGVVAHKIIAKYLKERIRSQPHINLEQDKGFEEKKYHNTLAANKKLAQDEI